MIGLETTVPYVMSLVDNGAILPRDGDRATDAGSGAGVAAGRAARAAGAGDAGGWGAPGDVTLIDPAEMWTVSVDTLQSLSHNTPLLGEQVVGRAVLTVAAGEVVHDVRRRTTTPRDDECAAGGRYAHPELGAGAPGAAASGWSRRTSRSTPETGCTWTRWRASRRLRSGPWWCMATRTRWICGRRCRGGRCWRWRSCGSG